MLKEKQSFINVSILRDKDSLIVRYDRSLPMDVDLAILTWFEVVTKVRPKDAWVYTLRPRYTSKITKIDKNRYMYTFINKEYPLPL
jgi:hypothetical protein